MSAREELAAVLAKGFQCHEIDCCAYAESLRLADALLASPALARVIREAKAEAWDEGRRDTREGWINPLFEVLNPYREEQP